MLRSLFPPWMTLFSVMISCAQVQDAKTLLTHGIPGSTTIPHEVNVPLSWYSPRQWPVPGGRKQWRSMASFPKTQLRNRWHCHDIAPRGGPMHATPHLLSLITPPGPLIYLNLHTSSHPTHILTLYAQGVRSMWAHHRRQCNRRLQRVPHHLQADKETFSLTLT